MNFLGFNITDHLHGRWCRFIIHRYFGHILEKDLSLDQLSVDLSMGFVKVEQVSLNVQFINDTLSSLNLPLRLVDGFIGSIRVKVPWARIMADASEVDLSDVQLTFQAMESFKMDDRDLVSSMLESAVNSLVNSIDLAQSFCNEEKDEGERSECGDEGSVKALSKVVDAVVSRFCCNIDDLILRLESDAAPGCDMATAVEFKIEKLRFMDEQMKACRQEGTSAENISSQSNGLGSGADLNKASFIFISSTCIIVHGVSMYTDVFPKSELGLTNEGEPSVCCMSLRREQKSLQKLEPANDSTLMSMNPAETTEKSDVYHSIQSSVSQSPDDFHSLGARTALTSNPVKFAEIAGETTIVIRVKNADANAKENLSSKLEFDIFSKGINLLVTPSQVELIKSLTGLLIPSDEPVKKKTYGGLPMANRDFDVVNQQLDEMTSSYVPTGRNVLSRQGNWQGVSQPQVFDSFQSINLKDDLDRGSSRGMEQEEEKEESNRRETAMISMKIGSILALLTHDDPLAVDCVAETGQVEAIELLHRNSNRFFEKAAELTILHAMSIEGMRKATDDLYLKDHIRLIGSTLSVSYSVESSSDSGARVSTKLAVANCDISEYLTTESTMTKVARHNPLFTFEREDEAPDSHFTVIMKKEATKSSTVITLGKCCSELDVSIIDRVSHLLYPRPFFTHSTRGYQPTRTYPGEHLFAEVSVKDAAPSVIEVNCANWSIDFTIPRVDLRQNGEGHTSHSVQNVHDECLRVKLTSAKVLIPLTSKGNGPTTVEIAASSITGHFIGDAERLGCEEEDATFLYAGSKMKPVRIALEFDGSNKSLKAAQLPTTVIDMTKSLSADLIKNQPKREGPFSQTYQSFTKSDATSDHENIIRAGSREEMLSFARDCMTQSDVTLRIELPVLRLLVPNHQFLELLYNRLVNNIALWQPSAPAFRAKRNSLNVHVDDGFQEVSSAMRRNQMPEESDDEDDDVNEHSRTERNEKTRKAQSHLFALNLEVTQGTIVLGTEVAQPFTSDTPPQPAQVVSELGGAQLFVCAGYHGDANQTYVHVTSTNLTVAQRNEPTIPKNVLTREFGLYENSELHLRSLPFGSHLREGRKDDSLGVALHLFTSEDGRVKETTAAIALRLFEFNLIPVKRVEECWMMQLKDLFCLNDFAIPGYEMPTCNTYLHINLDNAILAHDHSRIAKDSPLKYKLVLGNVDVNSTLVPSMKVNKFLCLFERVHLHMMKEAVEDRTVSYDDETPKVKKAPGMVHILEIGFFQLEMSMLNELAVREEEKRNCPLFELKCQNDQIKAWVCHDSLTTLINTAVEVAQSEFFKGDIPEDDEMVLSTHEETSSIASGTTMKTGISYNPDLERRLRQMVENACEEAPVAPSPVPQSNEDNAFDSTLLEDAMRDSWMGPDVPRERSDSQSTDESFVMVENIPGCGITSLSGEPRIRLIDDETAENGDYFFNYIPEHLPAGDMRSDCFKLPEDHPVPIIRCQLKDISIQLHIFGGNDLGTCQETNKSYSSEEHRQGSGRGQRGVKREARGGANRDHSVSICLELDKISYLHQMFDTNASIRSMNFISIQDVTVHDRLTLSNIKEMLYQYATSDEPRRTCAPMIAIRMVENHEKEGKLRVSMLPIRLNIDQDTLEFLEDFIQDVPAGLALPEAVKRQPRTRQPSIQVSEGLESIRPSSRSVTPQMNKLSYSNYSEDFSGVLPSAPPLSLPEDSPAVYPVFSPQRDSLSRFDMDAAQMQMALDEIDKPMGAWASTSVSSNLLAGSTTERSDDEVSVARSMSIGIAEDEERRGVEDDRETICTEAPCLRSVSQREETVGDTTFFKEFIFAPDCTIYIDYHGKNKYNMERSGGTVMGVLRGIGQLNRTEINLGSIEYRNGLLGVGRCATHAITTWQESIISNLPYALSSVGPFSPIVQIGKGIADLFLLPLSEMCKEDGHVYKGLQRGTSSFGFSTAAAVVDLAQRVVGAVQVTAESVLYELTPVHPALNLRNRRQNTGQLVRSPKNVQHGMQLAYDLIATGAQQTRQDLELAAQEDRASGRSSMNALMRHATPALLRPFIIGSQISYHFLGGLKNQLRPDEFHDDQHKWRDERDRAGTGGN